MHIVFGQKNILAPWVCCHKQKMPNISMVSKYGIVAYSSFLKIHLIYSQLFDVIWPQFKWNKLFAYFCTPQV